MTFYMLRKIGTDKWYKRGGCCGIDWTDQKHASVWTTLDGPRGCLGNITRKNRGDTMPINTEIVTFETVEHES